MPPASVTARRSPSLDEEQRARVAVVLLPGRAQPSRPAAGGMSPARVLPEHLGELGDGQALPAGQEEQDGQRRRLANEVEVAEAEPVPVLVVVRAGDEQRLAEDGGQRRGPRVEHRLVRARPVAGRLAGHHALLVVSVVDQPLHGERVLPQVREVVGLDAERARRVGRVFRRQVAVVGDLAAILPHPGRRARPAAGQRGAPRLRGELGRRRQPDGRQRVRQPEGLLDINGVEVRIVPSATSGTSGFWAMNRSLAGSGTGRDTPGAGHRRFFAAMRAARRASFAICRSGW